MSAAAVADPRVSIWGIATAAVLDHTPADQPDHRRAAAAGIAVHDYLRGLRELTTAGHLNTPTPHPPGPATHTGTEAHLAPLIDGRWAYRLRIHHHTDPTPHENATGIVDTLADLLSEHAERCCPITAIHDRFRPRTQSGIARTARQTTHTTTPPQPGADALIAPVDHRVVVPAGYRDPWLVAADASADNTTGLVTWAVVTGAGWVRRGRFPSDRSNGGRSLLGELHAAIEALRGYRPNSAITLLSDNTSIVNLITLAHTRTRRRTPDPVNGAWLAQHRDPLLALLGERTVTPRWTPRTHPMIAVADAFTRSHTPPNVTITHTSVCDPDDPDHTHCHNTRFHCPQPEPAET